MSDDSGNRKSTGTEASGQDAESLNELISRIAGQQANFEVILENMAQGVALFDQQQRLVFYNRRYTQLYGIDDYIVDHGMRFHELLALHAQAKAYPQKNALEQIQQSLTRMSHRRDSNHLYFLRNEGVINVHHIPFAEGGWLECHDDVTELHRLRRDIEHMAFHDQLTKLPNRNLLMAKYYQAKSEKNDKLGILYMDLDGFKKVNDEHGHLAGDKLLVMFGERLTGSIRACDIAARIGGDEFVILFSFQDPVSEANFLANRILDAIGSPFVIEGNEHFIGSSIGVAFTTGCDNQSFTDLIRAADMAMFDAKRSGGNQICFPQPHRYENPVSSAHTEAGNKIPARMGST